MRRGAPLRQQSDRQAARRQEDAPVRRLTAERVGGHCEGCCRFVGSSAMAGDAHHVFLTRLPREQADHPALRVWACWECHRDRIHGAKRDVALCDRLELLAVARLTGRPCPADEVPIDVVRRWFREGRG